MTLRRFVKKLPGVLQTEVQKEFYAATFDQLFNPANVEAAQGFIGRRTSDVLDPLTDNYLEEPTKNRAAYQLEPIAYAVNAALEDTNQFFYEDMINYIKHKGGNIDNHDRLFADLYYSFAPPIDVDKYLNYQNYLWLPGDGTDPTNTPPVGFLLVNASITPTQYDTIIETQIIGASTFNTSQVGGLIPQNFEFTSGMRLQFVGSASYNRPFYVEGVGRSIRLVEEEAVVYRNTDDGPETSQEILATPDYITIERGSVEGSAWSRSNRWFHEDAVDRITQLGQLQGGTIIQGGAGYDIGDVLLITDGDGTGGSFVVTSISLGGVIDGIAVFTRGSGYNFAIVDETGVPSPVSDLQWDNEDPFGLGSAWDPDNILSNPSGYLTIALQDETDFDESIIGGSVALGGTGYTVGDTLTIVGGTFTTAATFNVDSVDALTGAVTGISILSGGSYSAIPTTPANSTGGTGLGCTINLSINGTFDGGGAFLNPADLGKFIALTDGTIVRIDNVVANVVTEFTIMSSSSELLVIPSTTLTQGAIDGSISVSTDAAGQLKDAKIVNKGAGYHTGGVINVNNTLGGAGGQITYTVANGRLDTVSVTAIGAGYTVSSTSLLNALDMPAATSTDATGSGFELNLNSANERGVTLWDDNTITTGAGAGAYIEGNLASAVSRSNKANRPILEFKRDLDLFDYGSRYYGTVNVAASTESFGDIDGQAVGFAVDGVVLTTGMRLIFLDPDTIPLFLDWDQTPDGGAGSGTRWDEGPWESSGSAGAITRFVWQVDASGPTIELSKYDLLNNVVGDVPVEVGGVVTVTQGDTWAGYDFYQSYDIDQELFFWRAGQQKTGVNQAMLYNLYDTNGILLNDDLEYPDNDFDGNEIFSYKVLTQERLNELGGGTLIDDAVLGFPLETKGFRQLGDVIFENDLEVTRYNYIPVGEPTTEIRGYYYFIQYEVDDLSYVNPDSAFINPDYESAVIGTSFQTNWKTSTVREEQRVIDRYLTATDDEDTFPVSVVPDSGEHLNNTCLVVAQGRRLNTSEFAYLSATQEVILFAQPIEYDGKVGNGTSQSFVFNIQENIQITIDGIYQELGVNYTITDSTPGNITVLFTTIPADGAFIQATNRPSGAPGANSVVELLTCTDDALPEDSVGYFEIPNGLENNPNNLEITEQSWNEFTPHFTSIITEQEVYEGDAFGAGNNYRDTAKDGSLGTFALQSQSPMLKTMLCSSSNDLDIIDAIRFNKDEYTRFKNRYIKTAQQLINEGFQPFSASNPIDVSQWVDEILRRIIRSREFSDAFKDTYMIAWNNVYEEQTILGNDVSTLFTTTNFVDLTDKRNVMYVYVDGVIQAIDRDYDITNFNPIQIDFEVAPESGAEVVIRLYENTSPAHIPATPTKLGLYPAYRPRIETDNSYINPADVIIGHDGSRTPIYGNEIDELLIELETRIYNGILDKFRMSVNSGDAGTYAYPLERDTHKPGKFRSTRWSLTEWNDLIKQSFFKWSAANRTDYITNNYYDNANEWTYNYKSVSDVDGELLPSGFWRGIFDYYYDTQTPESTPWEMLGFADKPIWWEECTPRFPEELDDPIYGTTGLGTGFIGYGPGPWPDTHPMWQDIENGHIRRVYDPVDGAEDLNDATFDYWVTGSVDERYARPGLVASYLPVDATGALKATPLEAIDTSASLTIPNNVLAAEDYTWGDWAPIEYAWRTSESYPFALMEALFLARPGEFGEKFWDPEHIFQVPVDPEQIVNSESDLRKRIGNDALYVHGETVGGVAQINTGYQVWITSRLRTLKKDPAADFGALLRTLDVKLGHKVAGFTDKDTLRVFVEGISVSSAATNLLVPSENIDVALYTGTPANDYFYGGVLIKALSSNTYQIFGYDILKGQFDYYERNDTLGLQAVNVGGQPAEFRVYENGATYSTGDIVKLNGIFYRANETHESPSFDPELWTKLQSLPISGGINASYKPNSTGNVLTLKYGEKLVGPQAVFDFLVGWGEYLEEQGWTFQDAGANGEINDWYKVGKDFLLWVGSNWEEGSLIMLSPGGEKAVLNALEGYPGNVERVSNGVYSILNKEGVAIDPINTVINREDRKIEVEPAIEQTGIYGLRVSTYETENIITFDNVTVFNDIIYDPVLGSRLARLDFRGRRTLDWTGKLEAAGFIITADGLLPNYENMVDSIRNYHNTEVQLDQPQIENVARHLIGFDDRDYFTDLGVLDDAQFQFYQGLVRQKGTRQAIEKLERNELVTSVEDELNVVEEWALKLGEFGGVCRNQFTEFLIAASEVKDDPQLVQLSYPASNSETRTRAFSSSNVSIAADTITIPNHGFRTGDGKIYNQKTSTPPNPLIGGTVYYVVVVDANTIQLATTYANATADTPTVINLTTVGTGTTQTLSEYPSGRVTSIDIVSSGNTYVAAPTVFIANHPDDTTGSGASATSVLNSDGTLQRIDILNPGSGYSEPPIVTINSPSILAGADRAIARIRYDIATDIASDDVILIDIDDETRWITKPAGTACDVAAELWPEAAETRYRVPNAGYVHKDDVTFTAFDRDAVDNIINNTTTAFTHGQYIWMARSPSEEFAVYFMDNYKASTIVGQTQTLFDGVTDGYGSFFGGSGYSATERIIMDDGTEIIVDSIDGSGTVLTFNIDVSSSTAFPARGGHTLTSVSSNVTGNNDFTLTVGISNEVSGSALPGTGASITMTGDGTATLTSLPREDVIKAQFEIEVSGTPSGQVTNVTVLDGGFGYKTGGTFTISRDTYGSERNTNETDAIITYTVSNGIVDGATVTTAGTRYGRNVTAATINATGSGYNLGDVLTVSGGVGLDSVCSLNVTELTTVASQDETNFNGIPANEGTFNAGTGHAAGDVITLSDGTTITVDAASISTILYQDHTDFDGAGGNGTHNGGAGGTAIVGDIITMSDGSQVQVTAGTAPTPPLTPGNITGFRIIKSTTATNIPSGDTITQVSTSGIGSGFSITLGANNEQTTSDVGLVSQFTVTTGSTTGITANNQVLSQTSTTGLGTGFALNMGQANQGVYDITIADPGSYSTDPATTGAATTVVPTGGTGATVDLTIIGDNIPVLAADVPNPIGWGRYLGNSVPNSGSIFAGGSLYDYEITSGLNVNITKDGVAVPDDGSIADNTLFFTLMNVRYADATDRLLFAGTMQLNGVDKVWTDDNGSGLWQVSDVDGFALVSAASASADLTIAWNSNVRRIVGYEGLPDVIVPEPFEFDLEETGGTTETFRLTAFNDYGQGSGIEIELTDFSAPYNQPGFSSIASIEIGHDGDGNTFDINSASLESTFDPSIANSPWAAFGQAGYKMYIVDTVTNGFKQYTLTKAFDPTTASLDGTYDIDVAEAGMQWGIFSEHDGLTSARGDWFLTFGTTSNRMKRWGCSTDWDLSTASFDTQSEDVTGWTETPNLNGGAIIVTDLGVGYDVWWLDGTLNQIQHWDGILNVAFDLTQANKAADIDLSTLTNFTFGTPTSMTLAEGGNKLIILDTNYNASGNTYLCEIPLNTTNDLTTINTSAPEKVRLLSDIYGTETNYQPHISGFQKDERFILMGDDSDNALIFNGAAGATSPLVLNTIDIGSGGDLDHGGSTDGVGYLYLWFPNAGGHWDTNDVGDTYTITFNIGEQVPSPVLSTTRTQADLIETFKFENAYVYEQETNDTLAQIPVYDPFKGILPGTAAQNIKYIRQGDPARYTNSSNPRLIDEDLAFDSDQLGLLWWDTSRCAYLYYEQDTDKYRRDNWGRLFSGSSVDIYEWTRHTGTPASWSGDGTIRNTTDYVEMEEWDPISETVRTFYYFWVKNRTEIPGGVNRTVAAFEVANIISNPVANLYQWFSPISQTAFMFAGVDNVFTDSNNIFQINYRRDDDERPLHVQWELGRDGDPSYQINDKHWTKMVDSLCGFTDEIDLSSKAYTDAIGTFDTLTGVDTPGSNEITTLEAHGFTDGAGVVYSKNGGSENIGLTEGTMYYVEVVSDTALALHRESHQADPIPPTLVNPASRLPISAGGISELHTLTQASTALNNNASALPTAADPTRGYLIVPDPSLSESQQLGIETRPMQSMFLNMLDARRVWRNKVNELTNDIVLRDVAPTWNASLSTNNLWEWVDWYADGYDESNTSPTRQVTDTSDLALLPDPTDGEIVKVTGTRYSIYAYDADTDLYNLVAREASRLNILEDVYTSQPTLEIALELREIIEALRTNVFYGDIAVYNNVIFFALLNYVFSEQEDLDWAFKTTYIFLDQTGRALTQDRVFQEDPFDAALEYITEAKPYHSKVRDFRITRETEIDDLFGTAEEVQRLMTPRLVFDQIRGGNLSVTEMRIAKYEMSQDASWNGYTTLRDVDGTPVDVRLGAAGRAVNVYRDELADIQAPSGGTKASLTVDIVGGLLDAVAIVDGGSGYTNGIGFTFQLLETAGGASATTIAEVQYDVVGGIITNVSVANTGSGYAPDGSGVAVVSNDVPTPNTGTTLAEFDPTFTGPATTVAELEAVSAINAALTAEYFYDFQGSLLINTSFGGLPTLESFELVPAPSGPSGSGYVVGEILTLDAGSGVPVSNALFRVATIDGGGGITSLDLVSGGSYTQTPTVDPVDLLGGSGTGAQVTTLIFENGSAVPFDTTPWDQIGFESSSGDDAVVALTGSPDGLATTIPGQQAGDYDGTGENGSYVPGAAYTAGSANGGAIYPSGLTFTDNAPLADTITRTDGDSFVTTDGIEAGMQIIVTGCSVDTSNNGTYTIASVTDTVITLDAGGVLAPTNGTDLEPNAVFTFHDIITLTDGTDVRVDSVSGGGGVIAFTIINGSSAYLPPLSTLTQVSVSGGTGSGFSLTLGDANETSGTFADVVAEETFSGNGNQKEFDILTDTPTFFMFAVVDGVQQVLNVDYFFIGDKLVFVSILDTNGQRAFGAPPAGIDNIELYTYIEAGDLINPQVTAGITEEMVPLDPRENLVLIADTHNIAIAGGGTGYVGGDVGLTETVVGGTGTAMTIMITEVTGDAVTGVVIVDSGAYTVLPGAGAAITNANTTGSGATIDVIEPSYSFRLHNDTLHNMIFTRNSEASSTTLRASIGLTDNTIAVAQGENLYVNHPADAPTRSAPRVAWIGTERIVYHGVTETKQAKFAVTTDGAGALNSAVTILDPGTGYTTGGTVTVTTATGIAGNDDAVITYTASGGIVDSASVTTPGTGYTASEPTEATFTINTDALGGYATISAQTEANYDGVAPNGSVISGGTGYIVGDIGQTITLDDGTIITIDNVVGDEVTEFTVTSSSTTSFATQTATLTQSSTTGSGTGFSISTNTNNVTALGKVSSVVIVDGGTGYTAVGDGLTFTITDATLTGDDNAVISCGVSNGVITTASISNAGSGYTPNQVGISVNTADIPDPTGILVAAQDVTDSGSDPDVAVWELTGVIRGTSGTHAQVASSGTKVYDGSSDQDVPVTPYVYWVNSPTTSYATGAFDGEWRYHGNNLIHFVLELGASTIHTTNSIVVGDTLRCTSGANIQNSYYINDLIDIGEISKIDITDPGSGYSVGDVINTSSLDSGGGLGPPSTSASLVVEEVDVNGGVTVVSILDRGTGYTAGSYNFLLTGIGDGTAAITVYTDREGLALSWGGRILSPSGTVVSRNNVNWATDRLRPAGLTGSTTAAAVFLNAEPGNALTIPAP